MLAIESNAMEAVGAEVEVAVLAIESNAKDLLSVLLGHSVAYSVTSKSMHTVLCSPLHCAHLARHVPIAHRSSTASNTTVFPRLLCLVTVLCSTPHDMHSNAKDLLSVLLGHSVML